MIRGLVLALLLAAAPALAARVAVPRTRVTVDVPDGWTRHDAPGVIAGYRGPGGVLAITRAQVPNPDAWRPKQRAAYYDELERGVAAAVPGYRPLARRAVEVSGVPTLELEARRGDGATLVMRILLFRTYALALAIEVPKGAALTQARAIAASFAPNIAYTSDTP